MANLLSNTTIGGYQSIHTGNIGSYAITSIPTSFSSITVTSSFDTASNDIYASMRVIRNNASSADGMYIGYGNSGSGITRIFGGGSTGGALEKYATYTYEPGSFRAPIFYDAADTTYYFDGNSTTSLRTRGSWRSDSSDWDGEYSGKIQYHSNHWYFQSGNMWYFRNAGGANVFQVDQSGNGTFSGDIYLGTRGTWLSSWLNQDVRSSASPTFNNIYADGWFRNNNSYGLYNQAHGNHFYATSSDQWNIAANGSYPQIIFRSGGYQSTIRGYVYADTSNQIGFLNNAGDWSLRTNSSKDTQIFGTLTVGSSGSSDIYMTDTDETTRRIHTNSGRIGFLNSSNNWGAYCDNTGNWFSDHSMRAPIFYDSANTAYYVDPAGTSNIWRLYANDKYHYFGYSDNWDNGNLNGENSTITNVHFQGHPDFWIGAGNTKWYTSVASGHHDLLINTMQANGGNIRGITFTASTSGGSVYRLGRWFSHNTQVGSYLQVDGGIKVGGTTDNYNAPVAKLQVISSTSGSDVLAVDGVNGRLFTVTDDLSDSLFSVNTIAGLPVIEAFADNTVKIGKYGSNSITISNSKIAINSDSVDSNFPFYVGDRSTAGSRYSLTNPGMGFNLADSYAQLQLFGTSGAYIDFTTSSGQDSAGRIMWSGQFIFSGDVYFNNPLYTYTLYDRNDTGYYLDMNGTSRLGTVIANELRSYGNTYLGDSNGDEVHINDILRVGATDSGDAHFYFGEGSLAGSDYGMHWYWDSGVNFYWYGRNAGSDTLIMNYTTNDNTYVKWHRHFHMNSYAIHYTGELHFSGGTRFINSNSSYLYFQTDSTSVGGIIVRDGNSSTRGYSGYFDGAGFGLLNSVGSWGVRLNPGNAETLLYHAGNWKLTTTSAGVSVNGNVYIDQNYGHGIVGLYASTRYQGVFAMGDSYKLSADGTSPGSLYGIAWTHTNVGGESKSGLGHQALFMTNGNTQTAIGTGIWTSGLITTTSYGTSANWKAAYDWGNHASAGYIVAGSTVSESGSWTGATKFRSSGDISFSGAGNHSLQIFSDTNNDAFISFHISGDHAIYFGLDDSTNRLHTGGWSDGAVKYQLWDSRDFSSSNISNWNTAYSWGNHASAGYLTGAHNHDDRYYTESEIDSQISNRLYQARVNGLNVNAFNATGLYRGSTGDWSNRPTITDNSGALLTIDTHPGDYHTQLFFDSSGTRLYLRSAIAGSWGSWVTMWHSGNLTNLNQLSNGPGYITSSALSSYLPLSGGTMSGHLNVSYNIASPSNYYNGLQVEIMATSGTAGIALHRSGYSHVGIYHDSINELKFNFNGGTPILPATAGTLWGSGNLTNLNQLTNGPGYLRLNTWEGNSYIATGGAHYGTIFYDSNDTSYYVDPNSNSNLYSLYTYAYRGNGNVGGTGNASWHPDGIYCGSTMWQYGTMYKNNTGIYDVSEFKLNAGPVLGTYNTRNLIVKAHDSNDVMGILGQKSGGGFAFQIYGDGTNYGFLDGSWAGWDIKKTVDGAMYMNDDNSYYLYTNSESRFNTFTTAGSVVIGGTFGNNPYNAVGSTRLLFGGGNEPNNYFIGTNMENYGGNYTKLDLRWHTGIRMGAQPGYGGIRFFNNETLGSRIMSIGEGDANIRIDNNLWIGGAGGWITDLLNAKQNASTAITTSNIGSQSVSYATTAGTANAVAWGNVSSKPSLLMYYQGFTLDANTMDGNSTGFTYSVNAPYTGPIARFSETGYSLQLNAAYSGGGTGIAFRTRNGDAGSFNPWRVLLNDANYTSYSPSLTGSGASGTWGINVTGSAGSVAWTNVSSRPTALSQFTNDLGNYGGWITSSGSITGNASKLDPLSGDSNYKLAYTADGARTNAGEWGRAVMYYVPNGQTYGIRVDRADYADSAGGVAWTNVSSRPTALSQFSNDLGNYGGWITSSGSISGNAATATNVAWSGVTSKPAAWLDGGAMVQSMEPSATAFPSGFYESYLGAGNPTGTWFNYINVRHSNTGNGHGFQLGMSYYDTNLWFRSYQGGTSPSFSAWNYAIHSGNIGSQSVNYANSAGSATSATNAGQLNTYGYLVGENWNDYYTSGKLRVASVAGSTSANCPPNVHNYGGLLSYGIAGEDSFQLYFPDNAADSIANSRKLTYRTGRNGGWSSWRTVVDMVGDTLTIVEGPNPKIVVRGSAGYGSPSSASIELVGDADGGFTQSYRWISNAPDWAGQEFRLERKVNNSFQLVGRVPKNTNNLEWQGTIVQGLSDSRVKTNIVSMTEGLDKIDRIRPVTFDWVPTEDVSDREGADFGFIAQELEEVLPEVVHTRGDGYKTVMYEKVVPVLVQAMKEQQATIENLLNRIKALEDK